MKRNTSNFHIHHIPAAEQRIDPCQHGQVLLKPMMLRYGMNTTGTFPGYCRDTDFTQKSELVKYQINTTQYVEF